jgi:tetratricopeptide (TPR) repeat protein
MVDWEPQRPALHTPDDSIFTTVVETYERGQVLDALRLAENFAPIESWTGLRPCVVAARIAANAGSPRLATKLTLRAWRIDRNNAEALAQYGYEILGRRGPFVLWQKLREWQERSDTPVEHFAEVLALKGSAAASLRDFANAEAFLARAEATDPKRAWIRLQRARLLECQDRVEEALETVREASALYPHPYYRAAVQMQAQLLQSLDRDEDAIRLLSEAGEVLQNGPVMGQLYALLSENGQWNEAETALERFVALSPLLEKPGRNWVDAQRARAAYHRGQRADAARFASLLDDDFHKQFVAKLAAAPEAAERVQLDVSFVRQHFKTCAPATLTALGRFWRMSSEHLKLAEAMCYDGTPSWQQRDWAEQNGWAVCEFRVTPESAVALLERGIPFAITTVEATSAHMMAVMGFDRTRGTLLLRDPSQPYVIEYQGEEFLKRYRAFGPHGMVFIPSGERAQLDGVELPEAALYESRHRFWLALSKHDRDGAMSALRQLESDSTDAVLTWEARLELATYDGNITEQARCLDKLLELFPNNAARLLRRHDCLQHATREERVQFLTEACRTKDADPALFLALARSLQGDAQRTTEARRWLRRAMRFRPMDAGAINVLADLHWGYGQLEEAVECYRFAANLEGFREHLYQAWFVACRRTRRTSEAITHLQDRFARFGRRSEQPALTLAWAWREMEQPARAREVLEEAIRLRPADGYLLLRAASVMAGSLDADASGEADKYLQAAKGKVRTSDWLRTSAEIAENRLDFVTSLQVSRELLQREPLALDGHSGVVRALARREGMAAALAELQQSCARFPHHFGLRRMVVEWSSEAGPEAIAVAARELLRLEPSDAWAHRELALAEVRLQHGEEALHAANESVRIEPRSSVSFSVLGHVHRQLGHLSEARTHHRQAVSLSVDNTAAISALLELARTDHERKEELAFIERELIQQVVTGDGLITYLETARPIQQSETLLSFLRRAHAERPDLWHAWSSLVSQLTHLGRLDEALEIARQAAEKFPHLPRIWLDLAQVHRWRNQPEEEIAVAERAFEMNPAWSRTTLALTAALERRGRLSDARHIYERALNHVPRDAQLHACHAHLLWRLRQSEEAFAGVERALRLAPASGWAWDLLGDWSAQAGRPERTMEFARILVQERAGEAPVWLILARFAREIGERLAAVDRALQLDARSTEAWDLKAELLTIAERFEDAVRACADGAKRCTDEVHILRGRHAWIEARRRQLPEAVRLMRAVLAENSSYVWGWHQLAGWLSEQGEVADATAALEQMQRLHPHDAWVSRQLGFLRLQQQDKAGARKAFATALELSPTDTGAAQNLLDLQLESSDFEAAEATLRVMHTHQPGAATLAAEIYLRQRQGSFSIALEVLEALCVSPDPDPWPMNSATDLFQRSNQSGKALKIIKRAIKAGTGNPQLGAAAVKLLLVRRSFLAAAWLFLKLKPGEMQRRAAAPLMQGLAGNKDELLFRLLLWRRREVFFRDDAAWGQVGFALSNFNRMKQVARWLNDWETRPDVQPWMLFNHCLALRHLGRYDEATRVARHVVQTWGHRDGAADMHLFLAVEEALGGAIPAAEEHLRRVVARQDVIYDQQVLALAKALVALQQVPFAERRDKFSDIRKQLAPHFGAWRLANSLRDVRRTFQRTGKLFHREGAGPIAWLWFNWKTHWPWLLLPLAPLVLLPPVLIGLLVWHFTRGRNR